MSDLDKHIGNLFTAELQFRLASAVRLAVTGNRQPLDLPMEWTHGRHLVRYEEIALRQDQAEYAASFLHHSATYLMAVAIKDAIWAVGDPRVSPNPDVRAAFQIARLVRNAFAHSPFSPTWEIKPAECRDTTFSIADVIELNTTGLDGKPFDWRHYGGPLALFRLCRFVRVEILKDSPRPRKVIPIPERAIYQQGDLILENIDEPPPLHGYVEVEPGPDGSIDLGGGHVLRPVQKQ